MARKIEIDGTKYPVTESLGYVHSVGAHAVEVETPDGFRKAVKRGGTWRFWTAEDRVRPLREALSARTTETGESK